MLSYREILNRKLSVVPFAPHHIQSLWKNRQTSWACGLDTHICGYVQDATWILLPCPICGGTYKRQHRKCFWRQTSHVCSHMLYSLVRDKFLLLYKMLVFKLFIIAFYIISVLCGFKFCIPDQCDLLQLTFNLIYWSLSSIHLRQEAIIDLWNRCPT